jgi:hypothetical protein
MQVGNALEEAHGLLDQPTWDLGKSGLEARLVRNELGRTGLGFDVAGEKLVLSAPV